MHVLKNWQLSDSLENIDDVIDKARKKEILNEHEENFVKNSEGNGISKSKLLMEAVSCYGDQLKTFLDILNETGNGQLAKQISEKKSEFVFMIERKKTVEGRRKHCSLLPSNIPTQFIYESTVEDVIDKVKEKYECRKPIADILYVVIACEKLSEIFTNGSEDDEMSCFLIHMYNIFGKSKEIYVIVNIGRNGGGSDRYILPFSMRGNIEMYIIENKKDEQLTDFRDCLSVIDTLKKDSSKKIILSECYIYVIQDFSSGRGVVNDLNNLIQDKIIPLKEGNVERCEELAWKQISLKNKEIRGVDLMSGIKQIMIFFVDGFWKLEKKCINAYINELSEKYSKLKKRIDIVIKNSEEIKKPKDSELKKEANVTIYMTKKNKWNASQISVNEFLSEYCFEIGMKKNNKDL